MEDDSSPEVSSSGIKHGVEKKGEQKLSKRALLARLNRNRSISCSSCLLVFTLLIIKIINEHTESSEYLRYSLAKLLEGLHNSIRDIFYRCHRTHVNHPPGYDCMQCSMLVYQKLLSFLILYIPNSVSLLIDLQNCYENMTRCWSNCNHGCRPNA